MKKTIILITAFCLSSLVQAQTTNNRDAEMAATYQALSEQQATIDQLADSVLAAMHVERARLIAAQKDAYSLRDLPEAVQDAFMKEDFQRISAETIRRVYQRWFPDADEMELTIATTFGLNMTNSDPFQKLLEYKAIYGAVTPFQDTYAAKLHEIRQGGFTKDELLEKVIAVENQIKKDAPTVEEAKPLLVATIIMRNNYKDWPNNINKWMELTY